MFIFQNIYIFHYKQTIAQYLFLIAIFITLKNKWYVLTIQHNFIILAKTDIDV